MDHRLRRDRLQPASVGGPKDGAVADTLLQEIDLKTGLVMYEWHSLDHVPLRTPTPRPRTRAGSEPFDYFHINSIDAEQNGDLLVDARNTWAAYDVDPKTGQVRWELGGKHSSFKLGPGAPPRGSTTRASSPTVRSRSSTTARSQRCTRSRARSNSRSTRRR